jgi:hypothetical protein
LEQYAEIPPCETAFKKLPHDANKVKAACESYLSDALKAYPAKTVSLAVDYLAFSSPSVGEPLLFRLLQNGTARVRERVLRHLVEGRAETSTDALLELYNDARTTEWAKEKIVRKLRLLSGDMEQEPQLARNALGALKQIGDEWALKQPGIKKPVVIEEPSGKQDAPAAQPGIVRKEPTEQTGASWLLPAVALGAAIVLACAVLAAILYRSRKSQNIPG